MQADVRHPDFHGGVVPGEPRVEIDHAFIQQHAAVQQPGDHAAVHGVGPEDLGRARRRPAVPGLRAVAFETGLHTVPIRRIRAECRENRQLVPDPVDDGDAFLRRFDERVDVETAGQLLMDGESEALLHGGVAGIRRGVRRGGNRRCCQSGHARMVFLRGAVRQGTPLADLQQQLLIVQARARLCLDLLKFQLGSQPGVAVVTGWIVRVRDPRLVRSVVGSELPPCQEGVRQRQRLPGHGVHNQQLFLNPESSHAYIVPP